MYTMFLNFAKVCVLSCLSKFDNILKPLNYNEGCLRRPYCCYGNLLCHENDKKVFTNDWVDFWQFFLVNNVLLT